MESPTIMEPFQPTGSAVVDIQDDCANNIDGDLINSSLPPAATVSLFDNDDDEEEDDETDNDDDGDVAPNDNNVRATSLLSDTGENSISTMRIPPSEPPPPPPTSDVVESYSIDIPEGHVESHSNINCISNELNDEDRIKRLRHRLLQIYEDRRICHMRQRRCDNLLQELQTTCQIRQHEQHRLYDDYIGHTGTYHTTTSTTTTTDSHSITHASQYWNVTASDAFMIVLEHGNTIASINGLRLGAIVTLTVPSSSSLSSSSSSSQPPHNPVATTPNGTNPLSYSSQVKNEGSNSSSNQNISTTPIRLNRIISTSTTETLSSMKAATTTMKSSPQPASIMKYKIPWAEINAALGQVAVLITTMEHNLQYYTPSHTNSKNQNAKHTSSHTLLFKHEFVCMGSTSKIGVRKPTSSNISGAASNTNINFYNLYYTEENTIFHMLLNTKKRNFDVALQLLFSCVYEICNVIQDRDRTVYIPYEMNMKQWTIANVPITYFNTTATNNNDPNASVTNIHEPAEQWTRAMKYLLSNLKHAMSYRGIGLWNVNSTSTDTTNTAAISHPDQNY